MNCIEGHFVPGDVECSIEDVVAVGRIESFNFLPQIHYRGVLLV